MDADTNQYLYAGAADPDADANQDVYAGTDYPTIADDVADAYSHLVRLRRVLIQFVY